MYRFRAISLALVVGLSPTAAAVASVAAVPAAHADQYDCDASYLPCDGSNLDYLDTLGDTPMPHDAVTDGLGDQPVVSDNGWLGDPNFDEPLGDPGDPWWDSRGLGD